MDSQGFVRIDYGYFLSIKGEEIMKLKRSTEEAICILLLLAKKQKFGPVKSYRISEELNVSDSYLKKIMRKLVLAEIVTSSARKGGGFRLSKSLDEIFLLDVYYAIEGKESFVQSQNLAEQIFSSPEEAQKVAKHLAAIFGESEAVFLGKLAAYPLSDLIE